MSQGPDREVDAPPPTADPQAASLHRKWLEMWSDGLPPARERLDVFTLRPWLGHISVYEAIDGGKDFRIRLEGTRISHMTGEDWTGRTAREVDETFGTQFLPVLRESLRSARAKFHVIRIYQRKFRTAFRMLLPVRSRADGPVDQVLLVIHLDPGQKP